MSQITITIRSIDYHRNGIAGAPFFRVAFTFGGRTLLGILDAYFIDNPTSGCQCYVISPDDRGCWRGDEFAEPLRKACADWREREDAYGVYDDDSRPANTSLEGAVYHG